MARLSLAAVAALLAAVPAATQQPAGDDAFDERIEVREVLLDVVVTDLQGNVIVGLEREDFVVEEDGQEVPLESVSFYSNRAFLGGEATATGPTAAPAGSAHPFQEPEDRYFVLLFHRPPMGSGGDPDERFYLRLPQAGQMAFRWTAEELLPGDHVAVAAFGNDLELHHDFTRERGRLGRAIRNASRGKEADTRWPSRGGAATEGVTLASLNREEKDGEPERLIDALRQLSAALSAVPGRKNLVLFGLDLADFGQRLHEEAFEATVEALNRANVAVYAIGVSRRGHQESLFRLAEETGGEYLFRFQSFLEPLRRISRQTSGFYLLSFRSRQGAKAYRQVRVRTVNDEFRVRARGGYGG